VAYKLSHIAFRTSAIYWCLAVLWILGSDRVLLWVVPDPAITNELQSYKGLLFVSVTALLLYLTLRGQLLRWEQEAAARKQAQDALEAAYHEKDILLKEVHHRVKNNLQLMTSLLSLQEKMLEDGTPQKDLFHDSHNRIRAMAIVHERLYRSQDFTAVDLGDYLQTLIRELAASSAPQGIEMAVDTPTLAIGIDDAIPVGLIVNELLTNAFKHAFPGGRTGKIAVTLRRKEDGNIELGIRDDGVGLPSQAQLSRGPSMGMMLVRSLTEQIGGNIDIASQRGTSIVITFPEQRGEVTGP
jgi:two-component sensor histidine kinase